MTWTYVISDLDGEEIWNIFRRRIAKKKKKKKKNKKSLKFKK